MVRILVVLFLFFCQIGLAQIVNTKAPTIADTPTLEKREYKGKVKEIKHYIYNSLPVDDFKITKKLLTKKSGLEVISNYDEEGFLTSTKFFGTYFRGKRKGFDYKTTTVYSHYPNGKIKQRRTDVKWKLWTDVTKIYYRYDELDRLEKIDTVKMIDRYVEEVKSANYEYKENEIHIFDKDKQLEKIEYLDSLDRIIKSVYYINGDSTYYNFYDYVYDKSRDKVKLIITEYSMDYGSGLNIYGENGQLIKKLNLDGTDSGKMHHAKNSLKYEFKTVVSEGITYSYRVDKETGKKSLNSKTVESEGITYYYRVNKETGKESLSSKIIQLKDKYGNLIKWYNFYNIGKSFESLNLLEYEITYWDD